MKKLSFLIAIILISLPFWAFTENQPSQSNVNGFSLSTIFDYLVTNWVSISLIISEVAALLSSRWSGILKTVVNILDYIIHKKKGSPSLLLRRSNGVDIN